jgi:hypothetical protein
MDKLTENISTYLRRRLPLDHMERAVDNLVDYELNPCEFDNIGDFVAEACDMLTYNFIEDIQVSSKEKDELYITLVDLFGKRLVDLYKQRCVKGLRESKKTYVVTESQYKKLLEGSTEEDSIEDSKRFYKMFKRIIDEKFSELTYDESPRWSTHEDDVAWKDSDEDVFRYNDYAFLVKRGFFWSLMNYLPISHNATKMMFERYFKERFPDKFFLSVDEFDA